MKIKKNNKIQPQQQKRKSISISDIFQNQFQIQLFNARCHDTGQKSDIYKAKMFKQQISKINSKKQPNVLNLYSMRLGVNSIVKLANLINTTSFQALNIADNAVSQYGIHAVKYLISTSKIMYLNLASNMISQIGLSIILDDLVKNKYLKSLDLGIIQGSIRKNSLGLDGARCLAALLMQSKTLQTLKLEDNDIGIEGAQIIAGALKTIASNSHNNSQPIFKNLKLCQNLIKTEGARAILCNSGFLVTLDLGKNFIKSSLFEQFLKETNHSFKIPPNAANYKMKNQFLSTFDQNHKDYNPKHPPRLKKLNFEFNHLGIEGIIDFCKLMHRIKFISLNLRGNSIQDKGLIYFINTFTQNQCVWFNTLQQLDLSINQITSQGIKVLAKVLNKTNINTLNISKNSFGDEGIILLANMIQQNKILKKIDFSACKISDKGIIRFLEVVEDLPKLQNIRSNDNYISDKNEKVILELIKKNQNLISLNLSGNRMSLTCLKAIKNLIDRNSQSKQQKISNHLNSEIYILKQKEKKIIEKNQKLQTFNREITELQQQKAQIIQQIIKQQQQINNSTQLNFQQIINKKKEDQEIRNFALKQQIETLHEQKLQKQKNLEGLRIQYSSILMNQQNSTENKKDQSVTVKNLEN